MDNVVNVVVYTTNPPCPKCKVLEKKLDETNIKYQIINDIEALKETGFEYFPVMKVNDKIFDFKQAVDWLKENKTT